MLASASVLWFCRYIVYVCMVVDVIGVAATLYVKITQCVFLSAFDLRSLHVSISSDAYKID